MDDIQQLREDSLATLLDHVQAVYSALHAKHDYCFMNDGQKVTHVFKFSLQVHHQNSMSFQIFVYHMYMSTGCPKLVSLKAKAGKTLLRCIKPTNPSVRMPYKGQSSFSIIAILYTYQACKTPFRPIEPTNPLVRMAYKGQSSFGKPMSGMLYCIIHFVHMINL